MTGYWIQCNTKRRPERSVSKFLTKTISAALFLTLALASAANAATWGVSGSSDVILPPCPKNAKVAWDGCVGSLTLPDGVKYVGEFRQGKPDGFGQFSDANRAGQGTLTLPDGSGYVGKYVHELPNGQGTLTLPEGDVYSGEFRNGKLNGKGKRNKLDGSKYVGEFRDGLLYGQGTVYFYNGDVYDGELRDDNFNGRGTYTSSGGFKYVGEFRDD